MRRYEKRRDFTPTSFLIERNLFTSIADTSYIYLAILSIRKISGRPISIRHQSVTMPLKNYSHIVPLFRVYASFSTSDGKSRSTEADEYEIMIFHSARNEQHTEEHKKRHDSLS